MYNDTSYLNYNDLNIIENKILTLTNQLKEYNSSVPVFTAKTWAVNDFVYIEEIDRIERGINNLQKYWYKPEGWIDCKVWLTGEETQTVIKSFSYIDINRWINNMNLIEPIIGDNTTIWNVQSYVNWNEESDIEWSDV